ncbi:MAG: Glu-tRNA(Gln) amidotransferase subunit GatE [Thermoplasmataceae archaeon]
MYISSRQSEIKIGLEIHLQLSTGKLFCNCPDMESPALDGTFSRWLFPTGNESGDIDIAALQEEKKHISYNYKISENSCLVEADEEPPHRINRESLKTAMSISASLNSNIIGTVSVMRKVVVDGSNTSGFQRTAIISTGGGLILNDHKIRLTSICLEEDSARRVDPDEGKTTFSLDRLGIPLVEISTAPDIRTFQEAVEVAKEIGMRALLTGNIRRDSDAIRQDVNFSMGFGRVEIKGISKLSLISQALQEEEKRQGSLAAAIDIFLKRGGFTEVNLVDFTHRLINSNSKIIQKGISAGNKIFIGKMSNMLGLLKKGEFRIGREISDTLKLFSISGFIHSDELPGYGISQEEIDSIRSEMKCKENDAIMIISITEEKRSIAEEAINSRIRKLCSLDFSETRAALEDGTSRFLRPISGSGRMYPETDLPIIKLNDELFREAISEVPKSFDEAVANFLKKWEISKQESEIILSSGRKSEFEELAVIWGKPREVSRIMLQFIPEMERKFRKKVKREDIKQIMTGVKRMSYGRVSLEIAIELMISGADINQIFNSDLIKPLDAEELKLILEDLRRNTELRKENVIAKVKERTRRPIDPKAVMEAYLGDLH